MADLTPTTATNASALDGTERVPCTQAGADRALTPAQIRTLLLSPASGNITLTPAALGANVLNVKTEVVDSLYLYATSTSGDQRHYLTPTAHQLSSSVALVWYNDPDISSGTPDVGLKRSAAGVLEVTNGTTGVGKLKVNGLRFIGLTSSALPASATELPATGDASIHHDTNLNTWSLAFNNGSAIVSVALA